MSDRPSSRHHSSNRPFRLGLTGGIAMGKSYAADVFRARGVPVFDADAAVHRLYRSDAAPLVEAAFPGVLRAGAVDREALAARVSGDRQALERLEAIVHPLVAREREAFLSRAAEDGTPLVVFDIPLLFETGREAEMDAVMTITAPADVQRTRALARPGMTEPKLDALLARQLPDDERRARADIVVPSDETTASVIENFIDGV